jgi:hypothetical protein
MTDERIEATLPALFAAADEVSRRLSNRKFFDPTLT